MKNKLSLSTHNDSSGCDIKVDQKSLEAKRKYPAWYYFAFINSDRKLTVNLPRSVGIANIPTWYALVLPRGVFTQRHVFNKWLNQKWRFRLRNVSKFDVLVEPEVDTEDEDIFYESVQYQEKCIPNEQSFQNPSSIAMYFSVPTSN